MVATALDEDPAAPDAAPVFISAAEAALGCALATPAKLVAAAEWSSGKFR